MKLSEVCALLAAATVVAGCGSSGHRAPIVDRSETGNSAPVASEPVEMKPVVRVVSEPAQKPVLREKDWRPQVYVVEKGDTLYSIAFNHGFDYHELADLNGIKDPSLISIGQEIRLFPGRPASSAAEAKADAKPVVLPVKEQPKLVKYAYSEAAMAKIGKVQGSPGAQPVVAVPPKPPVVTAPTVVPGSDDVGEAELKWTMPAQGRLIARFSEAANRKGIEIAGKLGQPVLSSASGKVVYSGSGLRGYGKLVIIKHNKTYLSAYAHNDQILVKEGQSVTRGQQIATMGKTDTDRVKLHFEIRRLGKPVDPAKFLLLGKS